MPVWPAGDGGEIVLNAGNAGGASGNGGEIKIMPSRSVEPEELGFETHCANCGQHRDDHMQMGNDTYDNKCPGDRPYPEIPDEPGQGRWAALDDLRAYWDERGTVFEPLADL